MIKSGYDDITMMKVGSDDIIKAYQGSTLLWDNTHQYTNLTCWYNVEIPGVTKIVDTIPSYVSTMIVDGVEEAPSTGYTFGAGVHVVEWDLDGQTTVPSSMFNYVTTLTKVFLPSGTTEVGDYAFHRCDNLWQINMENTVITRIGKSSFNYFGMAHLSTPYAEIHMPSTLREIAQDAFRDTKIVGGVHLNEGLETIGRKAFNNSDSAAYQITIPSTVTFIGGDCLSTMEYIRFEGLTPPTFGESSEWGGEHLYAIYVPQASIDLYKAALPQFADKIVGY